MAKARAHRTRRTQENGVSTATADSSSDATIEPIGLSGALDRETRAAEDADNAEKRSAENAEKRGEVRDPRRNLAPAADDWGHADPGGRLLRCFSCGGRLRGACARLAMTGCHRLSPRLPRPDRRGPRLAGSAGSAGSVRSACSPTTGAPVTGRVGADGGIVSRLLFAVVGDTRPPPSTTPAAIRRMSSPRSTRASTLSNPAGDGPLDGRLHVRVGSPRGGDSQAGPQLDIYMQARARSPAPSFGARQTTSAPAQRARTAAADRRRDDGETTSPSSSRCSGRSERPTPTTRSTSSRWTPVDGEVVFVAANAWSGAQEAWLDPPREAEHVHLRGRHEPASATAPRA